MFSRWEDDLGETLSVHPDYTIVMDEDKSVTAIFEEIEYVLTMAVVGEGTTVPAAGLYGYGDGAVVIVSATPSDGWDFDRWEGDLTGSVNPTTVTMDADKSVTAVFLRATHYTLTMAVDGNGTVDPAPGAHEIADGALVTLTATPAEGWHFVHWQGGLQSVENPATVTMDEDRSVTAVFAESAPVSTADEKPPNTRSLECPTAATPSPPGGNPGPMALSLAVCWIAAKLLARRGRRRASDG